MAALTKKRDPRSLPPALQTTAEKIALREYYKAANALKRDNAKRSAGGKRPHAINPDDPWSEVEWRTCTPDCHHKRTP